MVKKEKMPKLQTTKFLQQRTLTEARALDRRQQVAVECTETGQLWQTADDGVKEIHIETVAQFVAAAESLDLQRNGKWGRYACLERQRVCSSFCTNSRAIQFRLRLPWNAQPQMGAADVIDAVGEIAQPFALGRASHPPQLPKARHPSLPPTLLCK
jgi:hypothetical protein